MRDSATRERLTTWGAAGVMIVFTGIFFVDGIYKPRFVSVDAWSYLELSGTVFRDFYHTNTQRQFEVHTPYSTAFPPLWPVMIGVARMIVDLGVYTSHLLNFCICIGLLFALIAFAQRLGRPGAIGAAAYLLLWSLGGFAGDAIGGGSCPLAILLLVAALTVLEVERPTLARVAVYGALCAFMVLTRFDTLIAAFVLVCYGAIRYAGGIKNLAAVLKGLVACGTTALVFLSPWMAYCASHFGKPFASDNVRQLYSAKPTSVLDYHAVEPPRDLLINPLHWAAQLATRKAPETLKVVAIELYNSYLPALVVILCLVWSNARPQLRPADKSFLWIVALLVPLLVLPSVLVGYAGGRYFAAALLLVGLGLLIVLDAQGSLSWRRPIFLLALIIAATPIVHRGALKSLFSLRAKWTDPASTMEARTPPPEFQALTDAVHGDAKGSPHRLLFGRSRKHPNTNGARYGALTGEPTSLMPYQLEGHFGKFISEWGITHVYDPAGTVADLKADDVEFTPLNYPQLFRVIRKQ